jgi:hypothetical protein
VNSPRNTTAPGKDLNGKRADVTSKEIAELEKFLKEFLVHLSDPIEKELYRIELMLVARRHYRENGRYDYPEIRLAIKKWNHDAIQSNLAVIANWQTEHEDAKAKADALRPKK